MISVSQADGARLVVIAAGLLGLGTGAFVGFWWGYMREIGNFGSPGTALLTPIGAVIGAGTFAGVAALLT